MSNWQPVARDLGMDRGVFVRRVLLRCMRDISDQLHGRGQQARDPYPSGLYKWQDPVQRLEIQLRVNTRNLFTYQLTYGDLVAIFTDLEVIVDASMFVRGHDIGIPFFDLLVSGRRNGQHKRQMNPFPDNVIVVGWFRRMPGN